MARFNDNFPVVIVELVNEQDETPQGVPAFHRELRDIAKDYRVEIQSQGHVVGGALGCLTHLIESHLAHTFRLLVNE